MADLLAAIAGLPVAEVLGAFRSALSEHRRAVLVAPPGAGKTTAVPLALLYEPWLAGRRIVLLEPRRIAARAAARRMASLIGEEVGGTVGYAMRLDTRQSERTRILVVTEGVFSRMILDDPELAGIGAVLFDEFHERSLDADFGLALSLDVAGALREDLRIAVMSATLEGGRIAESLGEGVPLVESAGRAFPVEIRYAPPAPNTAPIDAMADAILRAVKAEAGSILAFLPGQREIERVGQRLEGALPADMDVTPLYGALDARAQDAAIRPAPAGRRKVVLATAVAETSVTIDGVTIVIDSGLSRVPVFEPASAVTRLETVRASRASADQRAGRAGRTAPGIAIRLWAEASNGGLPAHGEPEILQSDLSGLVLDCAAFGVADPASLPFLDPPPAPALAEAKALLTRLGAIDAASSLTAKGETMRMLALPARLAAMVGEAGALSRKEGERAGALALLLTERGLGGTMVDLERRLQRFSSERGGRADGARKLAARLAKTAAGRTGPDETAGAPRSAGALLLFAYPDRLARQRGGHGRFVLASGRGAFLDEIDPLAGEPWLVVADLSGAARQSRILSAAPVTEAEVLAHFEGRIEAHSTGFFDASSASLTRRIRRSIGAITLRETTGRIEPGPDADAALLSAIAEAGLSVLPFSEAQGSLRRRLSFLHRTIGEPWPAMDDDALLAGLEDWLLPFMNGSGRLADLKPHLADALRSRVPFDLHRQIDTLAPSHFEAPTGSRLPIDYGGAAPSVSVRVQELFGLKIHPAIGGAGKGTGKAAGVPLTLLLLSPAHRPIQTTADLPGFWAGSWADVRAEMRGRYPKHPWPDDPAAAEPTRRTKRADARGR